MGNEKELRIQLYAFSVVSYGGPISVNIYEHHTLRFLADNPHILKLPPGPYRIFRIATDRFIDLDRTCRQMGVKGDEVFFLVAPSLEVETVKLIWKSIKPEGHAPEPGREARSPPINVGIGLAGPTVSTDVVEWGRRLRDRLRRFLR